MRGSVFVLFVGLACSVPNHPRSDHEARLAPAESVQGGAAKGVPQAHYRFRIVDPAEARVDCELELRALSGPVTLSLPERIAFLVLDEPRFVSAPRIVATEAQGASEGNGESAAVLERLEPYAWRLEPGAASTVRLAWSVPLDHRELPEVAARAGFEFPYLRKDHGMLALGVLALAPEQLDAGRVRVDFELPDGWPVHAPWESADDGSFSPASRESLQQDLVAVGDWQVHEEHVAGMDLTLAFSPGQRAMFDAVVARAPTIIEETLRHFGVTPQPAYLFLFGEPQPNGYGGSPKIASMTLFVDPELPADFAVQGVTHLIAHEFHHTWMRARCAPVDALRYLAEGFTDYYAYLLPWRAGLTGDAELRGAFEAKLAEYEQAQAGSARTLEEAGGPEFFQGAEAYRATYAGGLVLALWLDLALRQAAEPTTLQDVLRRFYEDPRWRDGTQPTPEHLWAIVAQAGGAELADRGRAFTQQPGVVDWPAAFAELGHSVTRSEAADAADTPEAENADNAADVAGVPRYALAEKTIAALD